MIYRSFILFFLFFNYSISQKVDFKRIFTEFDNYNYRTVDSLINNYSNINFIPNTQQDTINVNLFNLIKSFRNFNYDSKNYLKSINWLNNIGIKGVLPLFINDYAVKEKSSDEVINLLKISIKILEESNQTPLGVKDLEMFYSLKLLNLHSFINNSSYNREYEIPLIEHYFKNKEKLNFLKPFDDLLNFIIFNKASKPELKSMVFEELITLIDNTVSKSDIRSILYYYRNFISKNQLDVNLLEQFNDRLYSLADPPKLQIMLNKLSINPYDKDIVTNLELYLTENPLENYEVIDLDLLLSEIQIKTIKGLLNNTINQKQGYSIIPLFELKILFSNKYLPFQKRIYSYNNFDALSEWIEIDKKVIEEFKLEKYKLIEESINNQQLSYISSKDFFEHVTYGINLNGPNSFKLEKDYRFFKSITDYNESINFLSSLWNYIEGLDVEGKQAFKNFLLKEITESDLNSVKLRIKIAQSIEELESITKLYSPSQEDKLEYDLVTLQKRFYLDRKDDLISKRYFELILDNIKNELVDYFLFDAIDIAIYFKTLNVTPLLKKLLGELKKKEFKNKPSLERMSHKFGIGLLYESLNRPNDAIYFFLEARAEQALYNEYSSIPLKLLETQFNIDEKLFKMYLSKFDKKMMEYHIDSFSGLVNDISTISELENLTMEKKISLNMMKYQASIISKEYDQALIILDELVKLNVQTKNRFYIENAFRFQKLIIQFKKSEISYDEFQKQSNLIKIDPDIKKTLIFNSFELDNLSNGEIPKIAIDELKNEIKKVEFISRLDYESQLGLLKKIDFNLERVEAILMRNDLVQNDMLEEFVDCNIIIDNIDKYNSSLFKLTDEKTHEYFTLLKGYLSKQETLEEAYKSKFVFEEFQISNKLGIELNTNQSLKSLQDSLSSNQAYLRFSKAYDKDFNGFYIVYIIKKDGVSFHKYNFDLNKIYDNYYSSINDEKQDNLTFKYFFKPIFKILGEQINELFIKNDGITNNINLESIFITDKNEYLIDRYNIRYIERPSNITSNSSLKFDEAYLFGNPKFGDSNIIESSVRSGISQLPNTKREIETINNILVKNGIKTISHDYINATEENFLKNIEVDIVHVATHGFYLDNDNTYDRFNWGFFASNVESVLKNDFKKIIRNEGVVFGQEVFISNFTKCKLVVLSACETGVGVSSNFGNESLSNSFIRSGAKNVLSSLWPVDDKVTQEFMTSFYENLMLEEDISIALLKSKKQIKMKYPNPKYWAAFLLSSNQ